MEWRPATQRLLGGDATAYHGVGGVRDLFHDLDEAFAELEIEVEDVRDLGDRTLFLGRISGRGKESGAEIESAICYLVDFQGGKVTRVVSYLDTEEALEAAGLGE